ncbi:MAG TPA: lysylphosphatidylglycerol synthase transmembrane domain-containing protein [Chloroflexia bacterium]
MSVFSTSARRAPHPGPVTGAGIGGPRPRPALAVAAHDGAEIGLGRRLRDWKTLAGFALSAAIILVFVLTAHLDLGRIWATVRTADGRYLAAALAVYFGAFLLRGLRWRLLLRRADLGAAIRLPALGGLVEMIFLSWFVNCLVPAKLGDAYRAYLLKQDTGAGMDRTLGTVVGERMADVLALVVLLLGSGLLILGDLAGAGGNLPLILLLGAGLAGAIAGGAMALRMGAGRVAARLPERRRVVFERFVAALLGTFRRDIQAPLYGLTALIWAGEVIRIWLVLQSFHITGLAPGVIIFTALAGSLLSTIPFTPAGLGAVEGASVAILAAFGVAGSLAGAVAVMDRVINYWSNIPVGALLYLARRRRWRA